MLVWVGCRFEEGCSFRSCWFGEGCWFGGCWFGEGCQLGRGAGLNDAGPGGDAGGERWGQGRGKNSGVHKDPPKPRGSAAALDRRVPPRGAAPCHNPRPKRPVIAAHGSPAFSTSVSPRNETAEKPTAEGERKRKYKKNQTTKPCTFGASIDPAVGNQRVPPVLRPSGLMAPMGCQEMSVTIRPPIPP